MTAFEKINKQLKRYEQGGYKEWSLDKIADYIDWAWKWKKITEKEKDDVVERICILYEKDH